MSEDTQKLVVVTGATRGLGLAITRRLIADGYHVIGTGRSLSNEFQALLDNTDINSRLTFRRLDLNEPHTFPEFARSIIQEYRGIYGLVNNAALAHDGVLATLHDTQITETIAINVTGTILLTKYLIRGMLLQRMGRVVNIASIVAVSGFNGLSVYGASKAALIGFTRSLAREVGRMNITVNAVLPGYMRTAMSEGLNDQQLETIIRRTPLGRLPALEDVTGTIAFLLSDDARMISGASLTVDGGSTS